MSRARQGPRPAAPLPLVIGILLALLSRVSADAAPSPQEAPPQEHEPATQEPPRDDFTFDPDLIGRRSILDRLEIHGRASAEQRGFQDDELVDRIGTRAFSLGELALFAGYELGEQWRALAEIEFSAVFGDELGDQTFEVDQARLEWRVLRDGKGNLSAGRFYVPFGIERFSYSSPRNKLVDRPSPFRRIFPGTYSDTGLLAEGALALPHGMRLRYEAAATFGLGRRAPTAIRDARQGADNNRDPQVSGRLGLDLGHGLEVGASVLRGRWDDDARERIEMVGGDAVWKPGPLDVRGEWVESRAEQPGRDVHRRGFYAQASVHLPLGAGAWLEEVEPVVRFDGIRANSPLPDVPRLRRVAAGLDLHLTGNAIAKVQVELIDDGRLDARNHGILAQLSIHW